MSYWDTPESSWLYFINYSFIFTLNGSSQTNDADFFIVFSVGNTEYFGYYLSIDQCEIKWQEAKLWF